MELRQTYLLQIIDAVHGAGSTLARPVRSVELTESAPREAPNPRAVT
jgi:hypothetical protein